MNQKFLGSQGGPAGPENDGWVTYGNAVTNGLMFRDTVEIDEQKYPIRVREIRVRVDSEGAGRRRGAPGTRVTYGPKHDPMTAAYVTDGHFHPPRGTRGGGDAASSIPFKVLPDGTRGAAAADIAGGRSSRASCSDTLLSGGGGYGDPLEREPRARPRRRARPLRLARARPRRLRRRVRAGGARRLARGRRRGDRSGCERPAGEELPICVSTARSAIVTGASSGIGAATARAMALAGARVALVGRDDARLAARGGRASGARSCWPPTSPTTTPRPQIVERTLAAFGRIDVLVHSAGLFEPMPFAELPAESLDRQWRTNVRAPLLITQAALPHLGAGASVIFLSSIAGHVGFQDSAAYCATKGAIELVTRALALELSPRGIRVNASHRGTSRPR